MAKIRKEKSKWIVDVRVGGNRTRPSFGTKDQAESFLRELKLRYVDGLVGFSCNKKILLKEAITEYLEIASVKKALRTLEVDNEALGSLSTYFLNKHVDEVDLRSLEKYQVYLLNRGLKASSVNRKFNSVKHFFRKCHEWDYCQKNPTISLVKLKEDPVVRQPLKMEEIISIYEALPKWAARAFYFAMRTSLRRGQICSLTWDCVDFDRDTFRIFTKKGGRSLKQVNIPMTVEVRKFLLQLKLDLDQLESNHVFLNNCGRKIIPATLTRELIKARKKSGVLNAGMHIARHTLLTNMSALNQSGAIIQKLAGHSSLTTSQKYLHHNDDELREALELTDSGMKFITTQTSKDSVSGGL